MPALEYQGDGRWKLTVEVGGKRQRARRVRRFDGQPPTAQGNPPRKVRDQAARFEVELTQQRLHLAPDKVTFSEAAEAWWSWWSLGSHSPTTAHEYRRQLDQRLLPRLGAQRVDRLTAGELSAWYGQLAAEGLAVNTIRPLHNRVRQVLGHAVLHGWSTRNAAEGARLPQAPPPRMNLPTLQQIAELVDAAAQQSPMARRALIVSFGLGVRRGELAGLRVSRILWDAGEVLVDTSVTDGRTGRQVKGTKTHQARHVPMRPWVTVVLREQLEQQAEVAARRGVAMAADPWVWSTQPGAGRQPSPGYFSQVFARARRSAGLEGFRLHDLRHGFASWLLAEGVPITEVAGLLGHANPATTAKIYSHADPTRRGAHAAMSHLAEPTRALPPSGDGGHGVGVTARGPDG